MKIYLPFEFSQNLRIFLQRAGYSEFVDPNTGNSSYPRFHLYVAQDQDNRTFLNLHLDQKKPSYAGSSNHNAEYSGDIIEKETSRLKGLIKNQMDNQKTKGELETKGKRFWTKLFR